MKGRRRLHFVPLGVVFLVMLLLPFSGGFVTLWEKQNPFYGRWSEEITFYNASDYQKTLDYAFSRWEDTGIPLRFREVDDPGGADLVIYSDPRELETRCQEPKHCLGYATIGRNILSQARIDLLPPHNRFESRVIDFSRVGTLLHEIGHVLGLRHNEKRCSLMNVASVCGSLGKPYLTDTRQVLFCGPWEEDIKDLSRLYDFTTKSTDPYCREEGKEAIFYLKRSKDMIGYLNKGSHYIQKVLDI